MQQIPVLAGERYGRLAVVSEVDRASGHRRFLCRCDCGREKVVHLTALRRPSQATRSCGCLRSELSGQRLSAETRTHGESWPYPTPKYMAWQSMIRRCYGVKSPKYHHYGGRGIAVCDRWRTDYDAFLADVGRRPGKGYSLDRIDVNGNYEPGNVRWADAVTQRHNRRK